MDPVSRFNADRHNEARKTIKEEVATEGTRDYVKLYDATLRLPRSEWHLVNAALEAELPPVSERLTAPELKALIDRNARWVPPQARTPSPVPRYGRAEDGCRIRSPSLIRRIRADSLNREKADELASLKDATERMEMYGKRARSPPTRDKKPITPRQALHIGGIEIKGVAWGEESPSARRCGMMSEM